MRLINKVAIVTGAASGIGRAIANTFVAEGAQVVYSDLAPGDLKLDDKQAVFIKCDVAKKEEVDNLVKSAMAKFGRLDIMVNNAGIDTEGSIMDTSDADWEKTIAVDLSGVFYGARAASRAMKDNKISGAIINIGSIAGVVGFAGSAAYCTAKGGVIQLTRAAALDLAPFNIRMNAIAPGIIATNMTKDYLADPAFKKIFTDNTPLGHVGEPQDIANAALYLASDEAKFVTGTILHVDGGWTAR